MLASTGNIYIKKKKKKKKDDERISPSGQGKQPLAPSL